MNENELAAIMDNHPRVVKEKGRMPDMTESEYEKTLEPISKACIDIVNDDGYGDAKRYKLFAELKKSKNDITIVFDGNSSLCIMRKDYKMIKAKQ